MITLLQCQHTGCSKAKFIEEFPEIKEIYVYIASARVDQYKAICFARFKEELVSEAVVENKVSEFKIFFESEEIQGLSLIEIKALPSLKAFFFIIRIEFPENISYDEASLYMALENTCKISRDKIKAIRVCKKKEGHREFVFFNHRGERPQDVFKKFDALKDLGVYEIIYPETEKCVKDHDALYKAEKTPIHLLNALKVQEDSEINSRQKSDLYKFLSSFNEIKQEQDNLKPMSRDKKSLNMEFGTAIQEDSSGKQGNNNEMRENRGLFIGQVGSIGSIGSIGQSGGVTDVDTPQPPKKVASSRKHWLLSIPIVGLLSLMVAWIKVLSAASIMVLPHSDKDYLYFEITPEPFLTTCEYRINAEQWTPCGEKDKSYYFIKKNNGTNVALFLFGIIRVKNFGDITDIKPIKEKK